MQLPYAAAEPDPPDPPPSVDGSLDSDDVLADAAANGVDDPYHEADDRVDDDVEHEADPVVNQGAGELHADPAQPVPAPPNAAAARAAPKPPKKKSGAWYRHHLFTAITPEHDVCVLDISYWLAQWKSQHRVGDGAVDELCEMIHHLLLPEDNLVPPSYHLIRCALGVPKADDSVRHVCDSCWSVFPPLAAGHVPDHKADVCATPGCQKPRFRLGSSKQAIPNRRAWFFGETETFSDLVSKEGMVEAMLSYRLQTWDDPDGVWASPAGKLLNHHCRGVLGNTDIDDVIAVPCTLGMSCPASHPETTCVLATSTLRG